MHVIDVLHIIMYVVCMTRNLTIRLDDETIRNAKLLAAKKDTSIGKLVAKELSRLVTEEAKRQVLAAVATQQLEHGFHLGGLPYPDRESLHER